MAQWLSALGCVAISLQSAIRAFAFVAIIALGLMIMFMEVKGWIQDLMKVLFGISIALFAASFLNVIFPGQNFNFNCSGLGFGLGLTPFAVGLTRDFRPVSWDAWRSAAGSAQVRAGIALAAFLAAAALFDAAHPAAFGLAP